MSEVQGLRGKGSVFIYSVNSQVQDNYLPHYPTLLLKVSLRGLFVIKLIPRD